MTRKQDPSDDLVYDGELGWIDPHPDRLLASIGVSRHDRGEFIEYDIARRGYATESRLRLSKFSDWAVLRAIIDDAERVAAS